MPRSDPPYKIVRPNVAYEKYRIRKQQEMLAKKEIKRQLYALRVSFIDSLGLQVGDKIQWKGDRTILSINREMGILGLSGSRTIMSENLETTLTDDQQALKKEIIRLRGYGCDDN